MGPLIAFVVILFGSLVAVVYRLLTHRERMAELEARRPVITLQLPPGTSVEELAGADELTRQIEAACRAKGIDADVDFE
ncbi:MAG: hypothetical protein H6713_32835 [Myxococcales bacterium]|nr:hypothetical protein [Myxococcales bacterium]